MTKLVGQHIENINPYRPGKPIEELERELGIEGAIKLASNENPLGPSPAALDAIGSLIERSHIYPDGAAHRLRSAIAQFHGVPMGEVAVGNGSNELLTLMPRTFAGPGDHGVVSDHAFVVYRLAMMAQGLDFTSVEMAPGLVHDLEAMKRAVTPKTRLLFVANPNNPTGTYVDKASLERLLVEVPEEVVVVVDEAYVEYAQASDFVSALALRSLRERLIVCRTFSKCYGLAGLRVGYAIGPPQIIGYLNRVRDPFNANLLGQAAAEAALGDTSFVERSVAVNEEGRRLMEDGLGQLESKGVTWIPSQTNFLLVRTPHAGSDLYDEMLRLGVIVRPMGGYGLDRHLRITIGTAEQVGRCLDAFEHALNNLEAR